MCYIFGLYFCTCLFVNGISKNNLFILDSTMECSNNSYEFSNTFISRNVSRNQLFNLSVEHFIKFVSNKTLNNKAVFGVEKPLSNYVLDSQSLRFHPIAKCENDNVQHQNYKTKNVSFAMFTKTSLKFYASQ